MLFGVVGNLCYSMTSPVVKMIYLHNTTISSYEVLYWKSITMMVMNFIYVRSQGVFVMDVPKEYRNLLVFRALIGYMGIQGMWVSIKYMPVSVANCIFFTMPVWTALYAFIFIKEKLSWYDFMLIFLAFAGVIIINNPFEQVTEEIVDRKQNVFIGSMFALSGALGGAFANLAMRIMRNMHYSISPFWFASGCTFWSPIMHSITMNSAYILDDGSEDRERTTTIYDWTTIFLICLASIFSFFGQVFNSRSY